MAVQVRLNNLNTPFILSGTGVTVDNATLLTDGARAIPLAPYTVMSKVASSQKWVPFTNEAALLGDAIPQGIFMGPSVPAADLVAGDVADQVILVGLDITVDVSQVVIENAKLLTTVITVGTTDLRTVEDHLANRGIFMEDTVGISGYENP